MNAWLRETVVTLAGALLLAGPVAALVFGTMPATWRHAGVLWGVLLASVALVATLRHRVRRPTR